MSDYISVLGGDLGGYLDGDQTQKGSCEFIHLHLGPTRSMWGQLEKKKKKQRILVVV